MELITLPSEEAIKLFIACSEQPDSTQARALNEKLIYVEGDFTVPFEVTRLPRRLVITGNLDASLSTIKVFNGEVLGSANFFESHVESFGPETRFEGDLDASSTTHLRTFNCEVRGNAVFNESTIEFFGPRAFFGGNLNAVAARKLKTFNHKVVGSADFSFSGLEAIGPHATFGVAVVVARETPYQRKLDDPRRWNMKAANMLDRIVCKKDQTGAKKKRNALSTTSPFRTKTQQLMISRRAA
jgi:hypothetical protein